MDSLTVFAAVGGGVLLLLLFAAIAAIESATAARHRRREQLRREARDAERRLQKITQAALQRMLDVARSQR